MGASRALGGLLCVATVLVAILHLGFGYGLIPGGSGDWARGALSFALPITVGVLAVCVLGFWLGWIMVTTKEVSPPPAPKSEEEESKPKEEESKPEK